MNMDENNIPKKTKNKKRALIFIFAMLGLLALLLLLNYLPDMISSDDTPAQTAAPAKTYPPEWFVTPDYDADLDDDADYQKIDRHLHYKVGNETFMIDGDAETYGALCVFWDSYFKAAIGGDETKLASMHTDAYIKKFGEFGQIAPQKICDISVEQVSRAELTDGEYVGCFRSFFLVSYKIIDNNGTFRNDFIDDNVSVPLLYELIEDGDSVKINNYSREIYTATVVKDKTPDILPFVIAAAAVIVGAAVVVVIFAKRKARK